MMDDYDRGRMALRIATTTSLVALVGCITTAPLVVHNFSYLERQVRTELQGFRIVTDRMLDDLIVMEETAMGGDSPERHRRSPHHDSLLDDLEKRSWKGRARIREREEKSFDEEEVEEDVVDNILQRPVSLSMPDVFYADIRRHPGNKVTIQPSGHNRCQLFYDPKCPPGPRGPPGINGEDGEDGDAGIPGLPGVSYPSQVRRSPRKCTVCPAGVGEPGPPGPLGPRGVKGPDGAPGATVGLPGKRGDVGDPGPTGPRGRPGKKGKPGRNAYRFTAGDQGDKGVRGAAGKRGPPGPLGEIGEDGVSGSRGPRGPVGKPGKKGKPGHRGIPGRKGLAGFARTYCHCPDRSKGMVGSFNISEPNYSSQIAKLYPQHLIYERR